MKRVDLSIVESSAKPGMCSFRLPGQEDSHTATDVRRALSSAGFKPGDKAVLVSQAYLEALELEHAHFEWLRSVNALTREEDPVMDAVEAEAAK